MIQKKTFLIFLASLVGLISIWLFLFLSDNDADVKEIENIEHKTKQIEKRRDEKLDSVYASNSWDELLRHMPTASGKEAVDN